MVHSPRPMELDLHSSFLWTAYFFILPVAAKREKVAPLFLCELIELYAVFITRTN